MAVMPNTSKYSAPMEVDRSKTDRPAPAMDWQWVQPSDHFVQFYERDVALVDAVTGFIATGLEAGEIGVVFATPGHREDIAKKLEAHGIDLHAAQESGQYVALDAAEMLASFMCDGSPEPRGFQETIGRVVTRAAESRKRVRAFGEMVSLLWSEGNLAAAMDLEALWNELAKTQAFCLFCAYSMEGFGAAHAAPFAHICAQHSRVIPAESYAALAGPDAQTREIARLQQKAKTLEAEIAQRKRAEGELSDFLESAMEGIHKVGRDGTILWANQAELEMLGYPRDEYIGRPIAEFHVDRDVIEDMLAKLLGRQTLTNYPARLRCKDGTVKHVMVNSNAYIEDGKFLYTRCFTRDVTFFNEARIVQKRLAAIVDSSDDAIIGKTLEGIITSWNNGAERIFGYTAEEAVNRPKTIVFPPDKLKEEDEILACLRRGERIEHFESVRVHKNGRLIDVSLTISPIRDDYGTIVGASTIARDVTEAKRQERELASSNAHLKRLMTETHHRVKNNLQVIAAMIEMQTLVHRDKDAVPFDEFDRLKSHVCTLAIVHDLLTKSLKENEDAQRISTKAVLDKLLPMLQKTAWNHTVRFEITDTEIPSKQSISLALVINELVSNALKHGNSAADVTFEVRDGLAILEVCDDGQGFPKDFDPVMSANIGLELVESLVRTDLAGQTHFENRLQGGARVCVTFPLPAPAL